MDVWFRQDVARILASTQEALHRSLKAVTPLEPEMSAAYREGFADALQAVAVAFGLRPPSAASEAGRAPTTWQESCLDAQVWRGQPHR